MQYQHAYLWLYLLGLVKLVHECLSHFCHAKVCHKVIFYRFVYI